MGINHAYTKFVKKEGHWAIKQAGQTSWEENEKQIASKKHVPPTGGTLTQHIINNFKTHTIIAVRT